MTQAKAEALFREWHQKDPRKHLRRRVPLLDVSHFSCIGKAVEILYHSDKWEKNGDDYPYVHDFTSRPGVWVVSDHADPSETIGKPVKTLSLLGLRSAVDQLSVAQLAKAMELIVENKDGEKFELSLGAKGAPLYATLDKKALLILCDNGPVIVRGGKMAVTARGIVK